MMDKFLISNWNSIVNPEDTVYHVGDFGLAKHEQLQDISHRLNGRIVLIKGNHDKSCARMLDGVVDECYSSLLLWKGNKSIYFSHVPDSNRKGTIHIHGHIHNHTPEWVTSWNHNVSVEVIDYRPVLLETYL